MPARKNRPDKYSQLTVAIAQENARQKHWQSFEKARKFIFSDGWEKDETTGNYYKPIASLENDVASELIQTAAAQYRVSVTTDEIKSDGIAIPAICIDADEYQSRIKPLFPKLGR